MKPNQLCLGKTSCFTMLFLLFSTQLRTQTTFWSDDFDSGGVATNNHGTGWTMGGTSGSFMNTSNEWWINTSASCSFGSKLYVHAIGDFGGPDNLYLSDVNSDLVAETPDISTIGMKGITMDMTWRLNGEGSGGLDYGLVGYSINSGGSYTWLPTHYIGQASCVTTTGIAFPESCEGITGFRIGFRFLSNSTHCSACDPPFNVDDILVKCNTCSGTEQPPQITLTQSINGGCTNGQIKLQCTGGTAPYTVQLYRFGMVYGSTFSVPDTNVFTVTNLVPGTYYATALSWGGHTYDTSNTKNIIPPATFNTAERNITSTKATISWAKITCANGYLVQYKKQAATWSRKIVLGNKDSLRLINLMPNTVYQWRVETGVGLDTISNYTLSTFTAIDSFTTAASFANEESLSQSDVSVLPNPATTQLKIQINSNNNEHVSVWLKDANGHVFRSLLNVTIATLNNTDINVSALKPGIYFLQIINDKSSVMKKVVINK